MQTSIKDWKLVYFYWLSHCPEDISHVGNVLNITAPNSQGQERQLVQNPDCRAAAISQNVKALVPKSALFCCGSRLDQANRRADWRAVQLAES